MATQLPKITISGAAGTGKTAIAVLIAQALEAAGIRTEIRNEDTVPGALMEAQAGRLDTIRMRYKGQRVVIDQAYTRQLPDAPLVVPEENAFVRIETLQLSRDGA